MAKMRFTDDQLSFSYALYFIAASYFKKASCKSKIQERKMYVQYQEQKINRQYRMEEECIRYIEKEVLPKLPPNFLDEEVDAFLLPCLSGEVMVQLVGSGNKLSLRGHLKKPHSLFECYFK